MSKKSDSAPNEADPSGVVERLRSVVERNGGAAAVSRRSKVPESTLSNYLKGTEARFSRMANLAAACGFSLDWLATGQEPALPQAQNLSGTLGFTTGHLARPAHYWALLILTRTAQEFYEKTDQHGTLAEVLTWVASNYQNCLGLPDKKLKLVDDKDDEEAT